MKRFKKLAAILLCLAMLIVSAVALTACGECKHEWGEWTATGAATCSGTAEQRVCSKCDETETRTNSDASAHEWGEWTATGAATCSGTAEQRVCSKCDETETRTNGDASAHSFGAWSVKTAATCTANGKEERKCANCTATEQRTITAAGHNGVLICETCFEQLVAAPTVDTSEWDSIGILLKDMTVELYDDDDPEYSGTGTVDLIELYAALDDEGELTGYGHGVIKTVGAAVDGPNNQLAIYMFIEDGKVYISGAGTDPSTSTNAPLEEYIYIDLAEIPMLEDIEEALAQAEGYYAMVEAMIPELETWYEEQFTPAFSEVTFEYNDARMKAMAAKIVNSLFVAIANENGTSYTLSLELLKDWNQALSEKKLSELVDVILGEGSYAELKETVNSDTFYNFNVGALIDYIEDTKGVDLAALLDALDALVAIVMDDETATLESVLAMTGAALPDDLDISALLTDEEFCAYSVKDALIAIASVGLSEDETAPTLDEIKTEIAEAFTTLEETTAYELIMLMIGGDMNGSVDNIDTPNSPELMSATEETDPTAALVEMIDGYIDTIGEYFAPVVNYDKNGAFVNTVLTVEVNEDVTITLTFTAEKMAVAIDVESDEAEYEGTIEIIPVYKATPDAEQLAAIKAQLAKAPELTADIVFEYYRNEYPSRTVEKLDDGSVIAYYCKDTDFGSTPADEDGKTIYKIGCDVYIISSYDYYSLYVISGCKDFLDCDYSVTEGWVYVTVEVTLQSGLDRAAVEATEEFKTAFENAIAKAEYSNGSEDIEILYDAATGQIVSYGYVAYEGHSYDDGAVIREAVGCVDIGRIEYKCTVCSATYSEWYTNGHDYETAFTVNGNVYTVLFKCVREGCDHTEEIGTLTLVNTAGATVDNTPDYTELDGGSDGNAVFAFEYTATQTDRMILSLVGSLGRVTVDVYSKSSTETELTYWGNINVYNSGATTYSVDLTAGYTYYFVVFIEDDQIKGDIKATFEVKFDSEEQ